MISFFLRRSSWKATWKQRELASSRTPPSRRCAVMTHSLFFSGCRYCSAGVRNWCLKKTAYPSSAQYCCVSTPSRWFTLSHSFIIKRPTVGQPQARDLIKHHVQNQQHAYRWHQLSTCVVRVISYVTLWPNPKTRRPSW